MERIYKFIMLILLAVLSIAALPLTPASAQGISRCGLRAEVVAGLEQHHQEAQTALGLTC